MRQPARRWPRAFALVITCAGAGLLLYFWRVARPFWLDEEMIALNVRDRHFSELAGPLWLGQAAPLGWLGLVRASLLALGTSERALRLVPVLLGVGTLVTAWWVGRRWLTPIGAAILALLCAFGDHLWFFSLELKHYSADACGALFLVALAAWAIEAPDDDALKKMRRADRWWCLAALVQWFGYGALFVVPGAAASVTMAAWRRNGWSGARRSARLAWIWVACAALHYALSIRYAIGSEYLQSTWASAFAPHAVGMLGGLGWLVDQLEPLAINPGGTALWIPFWILAASGLAIGVVMRPALGPIAASVPVTAFTLAALRLVPLSGRLSLWMTPALYLGIAFVADAAVTLWLAPPWRRRWIGRTAAVICAALVARVSVDVVHTGVMDMANRPAGSHELDDRAAVRWLMRQRHPGDAVLSTHFALPAVWWYGSVDLSASGSQLADGSAIFEIGRAEKPTDCPPDELPSAVRGINGAAIYLGFLMPAGFDSLALSRLGEIGAVTTYRRFDEASHVALVNFRLPPTGPIVVPRPRGVEPGPPATGCVGIRRAERW